MATQPNVGNHSVSDTVAPATSYSPFRVALLLFLFLNCVYLATSTGRVRTIDEIDPVLQSESLLLHHSTAISQALNTGIWFGKRDRNGVPRSAWPAGHALMLLPWSAFGHYGLSRLPGMPSSIADLAIGTSICWSNATFAALSAAACFLLFLTLGTNPNKALACSLLVAFATPLFVYSGWTYSEPVTTALFLVAALLLFTGSNTASTIRIMTGAVILGFSIHVRPANMVTVLVFIVAAIVQGRSARQSKFLYRTAAIVIVVVGLSGLLYLYRNYALFGNPLDFGVPTTAENGKDLDSWHNPMWRGICGFLFSPGKSVFLFSPPIVLGMLGLSRLWRRNHALGVIASAAPVANLLMFSTRTQWEGSYCYGPRYLLPSLTLLLLPFPLLFENPPRWVRLAFWMAAISGFLVQAIGLSTNIMEDMVNNHYYIGTWDYRMSYSAVTGQLHLIWKYLHQSPTQFGLGWDRWFVFLRSAGASPTLVMQIEIAFLAGALVFGYLTWKMSKNAHFEHS